MIPIYEYYDGYEHLWEEQSPEERPRVRYIYLGDMPPIDDSGSGSDSHVVICYVSDPPFRAIIGKNTHTKAWTQGAVSPSEALAILEATERNDLHGHTLEGLQKEIQCATSNRAALDALYNITKPNFSSSYSDSKFNTHVRLQYGDSYTEKYIAELSKQLAMHQVTYAFMASLG